MIISDYIFFLLGTLLYSVVSYFRFVGCYALILSRYGGGFATLPQCQEYKGVSKILSSFRSNYCKKSDTIQKFIIAFSFIDTLQQFQGLRFGTATEQTQIVN